MKYYNYVLISIQLFAVVILSKRSFPNFHLMIDKYDHNDRKSFNITPIFIYCLDNQYQINNIDVVEKIDSVQNTNNMINEKSIIDNTLNNIIEESENIDISKVLSVESKSDDRNDAPNDDDDDNSKLKILEISDTIEESSSPITICTDFNATLSIHKIKLLSLVDILNSYIEEPPSSESIHTILQGYIPDTIINTNDSTNSTSISINKVQDSIHSPLRANGTDKDSLYRQLLAQFIDPLAISNKRSIWLDQEFVLNLKGTAALAQHPELIANLTGSILPKSCRSIKLSSSKLNEVSTGACFLLEIIVKALSHSLNSNFVQLNQQTIKRVRDYVISEGLPSSLASATTADLIASLITAINNRPQPTIILMNDDLQWLTGDEDASNVILNAIDDNSSNILFIAIEPDESIKVGQSIPSCKPTTSTPSVNTEDSENSPFSSFTNAFPNIFGGPPKTNQSPSPSNPPNGNKNTNQGSKPPSNPTFGFPFPPPPPGMMGPHSSGNGAITGRSFQVVIQNGTATMIPLSPGIIPPGFIPGNPPPNTPEGAAMMRNFIMEQQRILQQQGMNGSFSFPLFPPGMSEEDIHDFMQDPENQSKIKGVLDSVMHSIGQQLNEQGNNFFSNFAGPGQIEVKVHMIPGMGFPPSPTQNPDNHGFKTNIPDITKNLSNNKEKKRNENNKDIINSNLNKLPGSFFKGLKSKKTVTEEAVIDDVTKPSNNSVPPTKQNKDISYTLSSSGEALIYRFDEFILEPPRDHNLKLLWDRFIEEEIGNKILKLNRRLVILELKRAQVKHTPGAIKALNDILRRQLLSRDEIKKALRIALKLQAGRYALVPTTSMTTTIDKDKTINSNNQIANEHVKSISLNPIVVSHWALDTAFCTIMKVPYPRLGKPTSRDKDELATMQLDKHEKALIGNVISPQDIGVTYDMIGGLDEVKEQLRQCITYPLKYPRLYQEGVASEAVKGVLLFGPPGTGKTMLAKAVATEGGATFLTIDASTIENKWLGESEKNAKAVFTLARRLAPCVVYLDEVDSILSSREQGDESSHGTLTSVKTTLMQEWDGLRTTKDRVVVIASTNRPFDLDEAVLRRLPRRILVDLPDLETRTEIIAVTLANNRISPDVNLTALALQLDGYTGSDIKEVCREAVVRIAHERAQILESGIESLDMIHIMNMKSASITTNATTIDPIDNSNYDSNAPLRPVTYQDFKYAMKKLKASVNDNGKEIQKVIEWNNKYGEFKRKRKSTLSDSNLSMYI